MSFIPIDAKADITGSRKGKITPEQHAQLNAWCLASKTGILDCLGKCEAKQNSYETTDGIATILLKKGYVVICGRLIECEDNTSIEINSVNIPNGKIVLKYNLKGTKDEEFKIEIKTGTLTQEDLNEKTLGIYEFELYSYETKDGVITLKRSGEYVPDIGGKLSQFEASLKDEGKPLHGYDDTKGTIEERLTRLGFKEGSVALSSGTATTNKITRQGNYIIGNINVTFTDIFNNIKKGNTLFTLPEHFRPKEAKQISVIGFVDNDHIMDKSFFIDLEIDTTNGYAKIKDIGVSGGGYKKYTFNINFGFEALPITK